MNPASKSTPPLAPQVPAAPPRPAFLNYTPKELAFGTSGLRGLVKDMTDLEVYINVRGYLDYLLGSGGLAPGETVAVARDLREVDPTTGLSSSPRITRAVVQAIRDASPGAPFQVVNCGQIPTPALALYSLARRCVGIVITGSHIPADRNGVKFYKKDGEVLKSDEAGILAAVRAVRRAEYDKDVTATPFDGQGLLKAPPPLDAVDLSAERAYEARYRSLFAGPARSPSSSGDTLPLHGERIVCYQHSAVGRDLLVRLLRELGATVIPVGRSDHFIPVDTEEVTAADQARYHDLAVAHRPDAIVSTDGDSDRPLVIDENGVFHRGDALGILVADFLHARFCAVPVSTTDALDQWVAGRTKETGKAPLKIKHTKIGSPHVIGAMNEAIAQGQTGVVAWEANGGFLLGTDFTIGGVSEGGSGGNGVGRDEGPGAERHLLRALPTRDAVLPILAALLLKRARGLSLSALFATLPARSTQAGLLDDFPVQRSLAILAKLTPAQPDITIADFRTAGVVTVTRKGGGAPTQALQPECADLLARRSELSALLAHSPDPQATPGEPAFGAIVEINYVDGVRARFASGDVIHLRPSGNAPQFRVYAVSDTQQRADRLVHLGLGALSRRAS